jgi:hypothetical protein
MQAKWTARSGTPAAWKWWAVTSGSPPSRSKAAASWRWWIDELLGVDLGEHGGADAVVVALDGVGVAGPVGAHEVLGAEEAEGGVVLLAEAGCPEGQVLRDRSAGDGDDLEQAAGGAGEAVEAGVDQLLERDLALVAEAARVHGVAHELLDEQRVALGLDGDAGGLGEGGAVAAAHAEEGELLGLLVDERGDEQVAHVAAHAGALVEALELAQHRRGGAVVAAVGADHEEGGGVGRGDELGEEAGAVLVAPLEVGHAQDQRAAVGDAGEQLFEAAEGPAAGLLLVGALEHALRGVGDELHAGEHGEEAGQLVHVAGHERGGLDLGEAAEVVGERVDDGVEGLEGDGLALVAAAVEDHGLAAAAQGGEEVVDEGGLADAGAAVDVDGDGGALAGGVVGVVEGGEQVVAADERGGLGAGAAGRAAGERHALPAAAARASTSAPVRRAVGSRCSRPMHRSARSGGAPGANSWTWRGSYCCLAARILRVVPMKGRRPVRAS